MSAASGKLVLVTGATGYIASHVVRAVLAAGFRVRATVRSTKDAARLQYLRDLPGAENGGLEFVEVDLTESDQDAWDAAAQGCQLACHVASPFVLSVKEHLAEEKLYKPAVQGTLTVLRACAKANIKRVVLTSSILAMHAGRELELRGTIEHPEDDWSILEQSDPYSRSKTMAEKAAWAFVQGDENTSKMEMCTINPSLVFGPALSRNAEAASSFDIPKAILGGKLPMVAQAMIGTVDVRDVAFAHVQALEAADANGKRFALVGQCSNMLDLAKWAKEEFAQYGYNVSTTNPPMVVFWLAYKFGAISKMVYDVIGHEGWTVSIELATTILGVKTRDVRETWSDTLHSMLLLGFADVPVTQAYKDKCPRWKDAVIA